MLARYETERGTEHPIGILPNFESSRGLRLAPDVARAHRRVVGLQLGLGDLFELFGIDRTEALAVHGVQFAVRLAAAGVWAYGTAYVAVKDPDGFTRETEAARRLGLLLLPAS